MRTHRRRPGGRLILAVTMTAAMAFPAVVTTGTALAATPCSAEPSATGASATVLQMLNAIRAEHGAPPLRLDRRLARSARRHSCDMVAHHYFAHESRSGARFSARIARTGWMRRHGRWTVGETLAWGTDAEAEPASIAMAWLHSPPHRHILLERRFRVVGIGIVRGTPVAGTLGGLTYTADFGT
jgi:uncharacterized protein YkwD